MLHEEKAVTGQVRVPDDATETAQVKALLAGAGLENAVVTGAAGSSAETAQYIAGKQEDGGRESGCFL